MLPAGAFAVVLMLGGSQIMLPAPAFVEQGRVWAPVREVLQRLGYSVRWQPAPRALLASGVGDQIVFPELPPPWPTPTDPMQSRYARRVGNVLYVPLLALRSLGLKTAWEAGARRVVVRDPRAAPVSLAAILNNPAAWVNRSVTLAGEYRGWDAYPFSYATRQGPPVGSGDWVLCNDDGAIYCTPAPTAPTPTNAGLATAASAPFLLTPFHALGRRLVVTGQVALAPAGFPYLRHQTVSSVTGQEGVSCYLVLHQQQVAAGHTLAWEVVIYNPGPTSLTLPNAHEMLVSVAAPGGMLQLSKQSYRELTSVVGSDEERTFGGECPIAANGPAGTYSITVRLDDSLHSHVQHFEVIGPGKS